ncbi:RloB family protein [Microbispora sp. H10670]|uniref:RloB family protein n=1 Tax=Microbispora sp. H10670 TaxID=2729108 RepID=UPI00287363EE|nr:RloB family protein [Microbispora sp. H10670]
MCEGKVTEIEYFRGVRDHFRSLPVDIRDCRFIGLGCDPLSVVEYAIGERDRHLREARTQRDTNLAYDEVWCVVDLDDHATLETALGTARNSGVNVVLSSPCFELWLLYHFQDYASAASTSEIHRKLGSHLPGYDKHLPPRFPYGEHMLAKSRARRADPDHDTPNRRGRNPSTNIWLVVEALGKAGRD